MNLQSFVILASAAFFLLYGAAFSLAPNLMFEWVTGSAVQGASAVVDFRATYGGMAVAVGAAMLYLHRIGQSRAALVFVALVLGSMAVTRTLGFILDGAATNALMYVYLALEVAGVLLAVFAMRTKSQGTD